MGTYKENRGHIVIFGHYVAEVLDVSNADEINLTPSLKAINSMMAMFSMLNR